MTELEKLIVVRDYIGKVTGTEFSVNTYARICKEIETLRESIQSSELKDRAGRAEKAVSDLQVLKHTVEMEKQSALLREHAEKERTERAELEVAELKRSLDVSGFASEQARKRVAELESALAEAQDRALRFEKMLKAEEARKDGEIVLEKSRVLTTARNILTMDEKFRYVSTVAFWALVAYLENNGDNAEPYRCQ